MAWYGGSLFVHPTAPAQGHHSSLPLTSSLSPCQHTGTASADVPGSLARNNHLSITPSTFFSDNGPQSSHWPGMHTIHDLALSNADYSVFTPLFGDDSNPAWDGVNVTAWSGSVHNSAPVPGLLTVGGPTGSLPDPIRSEAVPTPLSISPAPLAPEPSASTRSPSSIPAEPGHSSSRTIRYTCGSSFSRKQDLQRHKKTVHATSNTPTYVCICGYKQLRKDNHMRHLDSCKGRVAGV
ncbi:putative C2H2-type domain-containing protein [Seiridium cardinale]